MVNSCMVNKHAYSLLEEGNLKPLPFLITVLAIVSSLEPAADQKLYLVFMDSALANFFSVLIRVLE